MISVTSAQLNAWLAAFIWPLTRILALVASAPVLGNEGLPARMKISLAVLITLVVAPTLGPLPELDPGSGAALIILAQQVLIGLAMGLAMRIVFAAADIAGELIGLQMGLGFATFFDPQNANQSPVVSQFLGLLVILAFLSVNGHLLMISVLADSFKTLPISAWPGTVTLMTLVQWGGRIFLAGVLLALPVIAALLIANVALGILTRAAPQLNIFAVGFPVTLAIGFLALMLSLTYMAPSWLRLMEDGLATMLTVAQPVPLR